MLRRETVWDVNSFVEELNLEIPSGHINLATLVGQILVYDHLPPVRNGKTNNKQVNCEHLREITY